MAPRCGLNFQMHYTCCISIENLLKFVPIGAIKDMYMATWIPVNIGSGDGFVSDCTKLSPEQMLTSH